MFETLASQIGALIVVLVCTFAFLKGEEAERFFGGAYILGWFASMLIQGAERNLSSQLGLAAIDVAMLVILGALAWKTRRSWPIWGCAMLLLIVMSHIVGLTDDRPTAVTFVIVSNLAGYGVLMALAVGTFWVWQERRAAGLD